MEEAENTDKKPSLESAPICKIHDHAASEVEVLESFSQAITRVVEAVAPAVVSIASRMTFRDRDSKSTYARPKRRQAAERAWDTDSEESLCGEDSVIPSRCSGRRLRRSRRIWPPHQRFLPLTAQILRRAQDDNQRARIRTYLSRVEGGTEKLVCRCSLCRTWPSESPRANKFARATRSQGSTGIGS